MKTLLSIIAMLLLGTSAVHAHTEEERIGIALQEYFKSQGHEIEIGVSNTFNRMTKSMLKDRGYIDSKDLDVRDVHLRLNLNNLDIKLSTKCLILVNSDAETMIVRVCGVDLYSFEMGEKDILAEGLKY